MHIHTLKLKKGILYIVMVYITQDRISEVNEIEIPAQPALSSRAKKGFWLIALLG